VEQICDNLILIDGGKLKAWAESANCSTTAPACGSASIVRAAAGLLRAGEFVIVDPFRTFFVEAEESAGGQVNGCWSKPDFPSAPRGRAADPREFFPARNRRRE
jgi:hypothetical protein